MIPFYPQVIASASAAGTLFNTYTAAKSVINAGDLVPIPGNYQRIGTKFAVRVSGALSSIATTPGTVTFQIMMGSIVAWTSGAIQLNATAHTLLPFDVDVIMRLDSVGSGTAAKFLGIGRLVGVMFTRTAAQIDDVNTPGDFMVPSTAPAVGTGFDSTIQNILDFWAGFSISNAGNGVQIYDYTVTQLNG